LGFDTAKIMEPVPALLRPLAGHHSTNPRNPGTCNRPGFQFAPGAQESDPCE
jgi:hypothetical protein